MGTDAELLCNWRTPDGEWGHVFSDGAVMTSGDTATTADQAMDIMAALAVAHNMSLHVRHGKIGMIVDWGGKG